MSWRELMFMGGYAFYVWGSYALTLMAIGGEVCLLLRRSRALRDDIGDPAIRGCRQVRV